MAQRSTKRSSRSPRRPTAVPGGIGGRRELVVVAAPQTALRAGARGLASAAGVDVSALADTLAASGATMTPLFGELEDRLRAKTASLTAGGAEAVPDLSVYYRVDAPEDELEGLCRRLCKLAAVHAAYVKPPSAPPVFRQDMAPRAEEPPAGTPDFTGRQGYLGPAPGGVDAYHAWTVPGGGGAGVRIVDIEGEWRFTHEDLRQNQGGVVGGTPPNDQRWRNHGTAVVGTFGGDRNGAGITGICPDANVRAISIFGAMSSSAAIRAAADMLAAGDIILIELHRPGPRFNYQNLPDQRGFIPIEWWPDDYDAIRYAVARGVIVVEAAGNGGENLDDSIYAVRPAGFPGGWANPFGRGGRDSGAILVGAGAPPPGTHGRNHGADRSRLAFSNYGAAVDAQGWGREVTTTGYGDLQGGSDEDLWYTDQFDGTSSASPIVVGALACAQGALRASGQALLTPATARALLRSTGSPQQPGPNGSAAQRIGNRPDLVQMIGGQVSAATRLPLHRYWSSLTGDHFYTTNWNELGNGGFGWTYEGIGCYVHAAAEPGTVPLYRYFSPGTGQHFYTTSWSELGAGRDGWVYEGVQCHVYPSAAAGTTPLHRYWNASVGDHFYTIDWNELGNGRYGWTYEGVQCWVFATAAGVPQEPGAAPAPSASPGGLPRAAPSVAATPPPVPAFREGAEGLRVPASFKVSPSRLSRLGGLAAGGPEGATEWRGEAGDVQVTLRIDRR